MGLWSLIVRFFQGGGDFMYPIAMVLVVGASIALERYIYLTYMAARNRSTWNEIVPLLSQGNFRQVVQVTQKSDTLVGHILDYGLARVQSARRRDDIEKAMEESMMEVVPRLEKRTHYIATLPTSRLSSGSWAPSWVSSGPSRRWRPSIRRRRRTCCRRASRSR